MLSGIQILDLTRYFPGPFATLRLQEYGAQIIKVEDKTGDPARIMDHFENQEGVIFRSMSRGKKSVSLDLKNEDDRKKFYSLVRKSDAIIESFRPGVSNRLKIDFEMLKKYNPSIVYVSLTGYGQNTSISHLAGHDLNYLALSGVLDQMQDSKNRPIKPQIALADLISGLVASEAVAMGLIKSMRSKKGIYIDVSMTDAVISLMGLHVTHQSATGNEHGINDHGIGYGIFQTKDLRYIALCALEEKFFSNFCKAVKKEYLISHHTEPADLNNPNYLEIVDLFKERTFDEWSDFSRKVDCCMSPVLHTSEMKEFLYVKERKLIEHKWDLDYVATHYTGKETFLEFNKPFPKLGEDNTIFDSK